MTFITARFCFFLTINKPMEFSFSFLMHIPLFKTALDWWKYHKIYSFFKEKLKHKEKIMIRHFFFHKTPARWQPTSTILFFSLSINVAMSNANEQSLLLKIFPIWTNNKCVAISKRHKILFLHLFLFSEGKNTIFLGIC